MLQAGLCGLRAGAGPERDDVISLAREDLRAARVEGGAADGGAVAEHDGVVAEAAQRPDPGLAVPRGGDDVLAVGAPGGGGELLAVAEQGAGRVARAIQVPDPGAVILRGGDQGAAAGASAAR